MLTLSHGEATSISATAARPVISVKNVEKSFGNRKALADISFEIAAGESVALLGPNGAGKTTTIGVLLGLRRYDRGQVTIFGERPLSMRARRRIGVTQQSNGTPATATVSEVISYVAALHGDPVPLATLIGTFGLNRVARRQVGGLSGGEQRCLSMALTFAGKPELVLLDEPTTGLDVESRRTVWEAIEQSGKSGTTIVLTTHYLQEAEALAGRAIVISSGRLLVDSSIASIRADAGSRKVSFTSDSVPMGLTNIAASGSRYSVITSDPDATVRELFERAIPYRDLEITTPSLEDVFLKLVRSAA